MPSALELLDVFGMADLAEATRRAACPTARSVRLEIVRALATEPGIHAAGRAGRGHEPFGNGGADG